MLYSFFVKRLIRQSFDHVNNRCWVTLLTSVAPNVHHRFAGDHALGGERHDKESLRRWFGRVSRVLPNLHLTVNDIWVKGWPWHTMVFVQWDGTATLLNGDDSYFNRGLHVITLRWGKVHALDVFENSQEVVRGLAAQAAAGLDEAVAEKIES
jgi:ketosteroid isomerase-like protein